MRSRLSQHVLPWLVPLLIVLGLFAVNGRSDIGAWKMGSADVRSCDAATMNWESVRLPYFSASNCRMLRARSAQRTAGWGNAVIAIGGMTRDARVYVNGEMVRDFLPGDDDAYTNRALLVSVPHRMLNADDNEILIDLHSRPGSSEYTQIRELYFGPERALISAVERSWWVGARGAGIAMTVTFAIVLFLVPIALTRRDESVYRWFLLTLAASALYVANFALLARPLPLLAWGVLIHCALAAALWGLLKFSNRFLGIARSPGERRVGMFIALGCVALIAESVLPLPGPLQLAFDAVYRLTMLAVLALLATLWWRHRQRATLPSPPWFSGAVALVAALGLADSLRVFGLHRVDLASYTMHWGMLYLLILLFAALASRILAALGAAERARGELAEALAERSAELEAEFSLRREAEQARTLAEERHRIMRDMHDGVGGQLVALIGQAEHDRLSGDELKSQLRGTLDDLRLMIDSLDEACADLSVALGMFRKRLEPSLARLPIQVRWNTAHLPDLPAVSPTVVLNVVRIVQEAITNALKHAQAGSIEVGADWMAGVLTVSIRDDGRGIARDAASGRGLSSMQARARLISAQLVVEDAAPGTCVRLRLPLAPAAANA
jgi:signal transduction histidine kinase